MREQGARPASAAAVALALAWPAVAAAQESPPRWSAPPLPSRPAPCRTVGAGEDLQAALDAAPEGTVLCLTSGRHAGPLVVGRRVHLWGPRDAVVASAGVGTTIRVEAEGAVLEGFTVDGSGGRFDELDAAIHVVADDVRVEGTKIVEAVFGLLVEQASRVVLRGNEVAGPDEGPMGLRGDGIRLWETRDSTIERNHVVGSRDVVVWYSPRNRIVGNAVERSRYGSHLMYSHDVVIEDNVYLDDVVGVFVMYSRNVEVRRNLLARASGAAGMGLGVKESGNLVVERNLFVQDTIGAYLDTTPLQVDHRNLFARNAFRLCDTAVVFHRSESRNAFRENAFRDNQAQVRVEGGGHVRDVEWSRNDWDDYRGYDLDGDGIGDVPHEIRSLSSQLVSGHPSLAFFRGTPALALVEAASHLFPLFRPRTILIDEQPRVGREPVDGTAGGPSSWTGTSEVRRAR